MKGIVPIQTVYILPAGKPKKIKEMRSWDVFLEQDWHPGKGNPTRTRKWHALEAAKRVTNFPRYGDPVELTERALNGLTSTSAYHRIKNGTEPLFT